MPSPRPILCLAVAWLSLGRLALAAVPAPPQPPPRPVPIEYRIATLRAAIEDLQATFGPRYPRAAEYLARLTEIEAAAHAHDAEAPSRLANLRREALLANPLLDFDRLLVVKRKSLKLSAPRPGEWVSREPGVDFGFPSNHECNSSLPREGYDNEIAAFAPRQTGEKLTTVYRPLSTGYVGEIDLHFDAQRILFTQSDAENWKIFELALDGSAPRQVSQMPADVDAFDACYLPDGRIVFGSTASFQAVPCWHGLKRVTNLYLMNADGAAARRLCFDQDHDLHPCVLPNGQVLYSRWDYTGINHIYLRELMAMNPDGTAQRAVYGSNSWYPNALYFPRPLPGASEKLVAILSGYHGPHRMGQLVVIDTARGWREAQGIVQRISGRGDPVNPVVRDNLIANDWPKFLHPYPLSDKYILVACQPNPQASWGIYLADTFDNLVLLREEPGYGLFEPVPVQTWPRPPVLPDRVDLARTDATVYLHDIYAGPGLAGVPRGTVKSLRVLSYHFGYPGLAGPDLIGRGGPWEVMRIEGTVPLESDGSAHFRAPAGTPLALQALDAEGKAVQLMRSWFTAMPGEKVSCVGCHETPAEASRGQLAAAALREPAEIQPWHGPPRGFDFAREVQPVLDRHCTGCHNGAPDNAQPDLRPEDQVPGYAGLPLSKLAVQRMHPTMAAALGTYARYTPAYDALLPYVRRVGIEDDVSLLVPGEYHADTSPLVQLLRQGHGDVDLTPEDWDRLITWIDLNAPCHGTWGEVFPVPDGIAQRRAALARQCGGPYNDPEAVPPVARPSGKPTPAPAHPARAATAPHAVRLARAGASPPAAPISTRPDEKRLDLGEGVTMRLVRLPGEPTLWIGACEVTNAQFQRFKPDHDSRYYTRRHAREDDQGLPLDAPEQPVIRVSWDEATAFCDWLAERSGLKVSLPTADQWDRAWHAGGTESHLTTDVDADLSPWANLADASFSTGLVRDGQQITGGLEHLVLEGAALADTRHNDGAVVTAPVGSYQPDRLGLFDLCGNAAEWTAIAAPGARKLVRGGSFFDPPRRASPDWQVAYPPWQRIFNVGFRIVATQ